MLGRLAAVDVVHRVSVEFYAVVSRVFTAGWKTSMIAVAIIEMMVYVPVKMVGAMEPWSGANEYAA